MPTADATNGKSLPANLKLPDSLPVLPLRDLVVFPYMVAPMLVSRTLSQKAVEAAEAGKEPLIFLLAQRSETAETPGAEDLFQVGTIGTIVRTRAVSDGRIKVVVQGLMRGRVTRVLQDEPFFRVGLRSLKDVAHDGKVIADAEIEALMRSTKEELARYTEQAKTVTPELLSLLSEVDEPGRLADLVAAHLPMKVPLGQPVLEELRAVERLRMVSNVIRRELEILHVQASIQSRAREEMSRTQREYFLREQLRQIQSELGGGGDGERGEWEQLGERARNLPLSSEAREEVERQLRRLGRMQPDGLEASVTRTHLEWLLDVPWTATEQSHIELSDVRKILDEDHYGLLDVKDRILEHLSVLKLAEHSAKQSGDGSATKLPTILCFVGPPGVGKTSLGRSIAKALGRRFVRMSLGGVRDEAEIRGHRRTYVGAMPGRIVQGMRQAGSLNPIFVLDEIDKLISDVRGDPSSALLEVLDPEQNVAFRDHYLNIAYDLSGVLFIATANTIDQISRPLLDRMEVIRLPGYSPEEKFRILKRYIIPEQQALAHLGAKHVRFQPSALRDLAKQYSREAGLRDLERQVAQVCRKIARKVAERSTDATSGLTETVTPKSLRKYLGPPVPRWVSVSSRDEVGMACGLAYTPYGGELLRIEAEWMPGRGSLTLTGQLGDVMRESAMTALSFARAKAARWHLDSQFYSQREVHIHVPAGAIPKDGPSAGVTMAAALVSLFTGQPLKRDVAMTGELTLRGAVLPVGGIKEKLLAAYAAQMRMVLLPAGNRDEVLAFSKKMFRGLSVTFVNDMDGVLAAALVSSKATGSRSRKPTR